MPLVDEELRRELTARYSGGDRHYHGLRHVEALLDLAQEYRALLADPEAVEAAIWFHDAVYDSKAKDNEAQSAALAREKLDGRVESGRLERIATMILATATHALPDLADEPSRRDTALFLDMDLSILGAPWQAFEAYEQDVREEYAWVPEPAWIAGRSAVLRNFMARPALFHTQEFRDRFEVQARKNIGTALQRLAPSPPP